MKMVLLLLHQHPTTLSTQPTTRGVQKYWKLSFELTDQFFPLNWVTWATTKNFSSLGAWEEPPLFMPNYTKEFPENTKEKSELQYFEFFYVLNLQNVNEWHMATILRSWRFFWHPYWHIHPWHMADAICDNYVINAKNDIIDIYGFGHMSWNNMAI